MITSEPRYKDDLYSFELTSEMLSKPMNKPFIAVRIHLIGNFLQEDVIVNRNTGNYIKSDAFNRMLVQINKITFRFGK